MKTKPMLRNVSITLLLFFAFFLGTGLHLHAQEEWEKEGEIKSAEVVISKERELTLPPAVRNFSKIQMLKQEPANSALSYQIQAFKPEIPSNLSRVRFPSLSPSKENTINPQNSIKLGFGNYLSPIGELDIHSNANDMVAAGLQLQHRSALEGPVDGRNSGNGETLGRIYGRVFSDTEELSGSMSYKNRFLHYYGYAPGDRIDNRDSIMQHFNTLKVDARVQSVGDEYPAHYFLQGEVFRHTDRFENGETSYVIDGGLNFTLTPGFDLDLKAGFQNQTLEGFQNFSRSLLSLSPTVHFNQSGIDIEAGVSFMQMRDSVSNRLRVFPVVNAQFRPVGFLQVYGKVDGNVQMNTFRSLSEENMWLTAYSSMPFTERTLGFAGGAKLFLEPGIQVHAGAEMGFYENLYHFVQAEPTLGFPHALGMRALVDQGESSIMNAFAEVSFDRLERVHVSARLDYFDYKLDEVIAAWHRPDLQASFLMNVKATDALRFSLKGLYMAGLQARDVVDETLLIQINPDALIIPLEDIIDVQVGIDYKLNQQFSAFGLVTNLLGKNYERYWRYPVRGLQVQAGIIWRF